MSHGNGETTFNAEADVALQQETGDDLTASLAQGCLKLGDEKIGQDNNNFELRQRQRPVYVTRYRIDHKQQTRKMCSGVTMEECIPCCTCGDEEEEEGDELPVSCIWTIMGSELVVFTLHMSAVIFGVLKEAIDLRHKHNYSLHFAHSMIETVATLLVIIILMLNTRMGYIKVRQAIERLENFDPDQDAHLRSIKTWMWLSVAAGFALIGVCIGCFLLFLEYVHLGWTILSNQSCIIISAVIFGLYASRVTTAVYKINTDQHKVVIYEALMLLKGRCQDNGVEGGDVTSSSSSKAAALRFIEAVSNTKSLDRPKYINLTFASHQHRC